MTTLKRTRPVSLDLSPNALHSEHETDNVELLPRLLSTTTGQRSLEDESIGNSSDTPLFSSDDHPAAAENYLDYHCKRQRKGPWWDSRLETQQPIIRSKSKREFQRNLDSGVWMGSDAELEDYVGELAMHDQIRIEPSARSTLGDPGNFDGPVFPYWDSQPVSTEAFWRTQKAAIVEISRCIDHGKESVDLSDLGLFKLQESTLEPLHFLVAERSISQLDAKWQSFETLIPNLQLYLAYNLLFQLPGQLFKLQNLTVLSLRHNNLTEIPSAIGDLVNLQELNLSNNRLRWLPYEILQLLSRNLKICRFHPNPFVEPVPGPKPRILPLSFACSTRPAFFRIDGTLSRNSLPSPTLVHTYSPILNVPIPFSLDHFQQTHKVPSLFETSLRACSESPELSQLPYLIPQGGPDTLKSCLKRTWKLKQEGGQRCSICKSVYIIPRTEWIEWWRVPTGAAPDQSAKTFPLPIPINLGMPMPSSELIMSLVASVVPFVRRGCSWSCISEENFCSSEVGWRAPTGDNFAT
ncbi:hypothetical protein XANCAGTX0491_003838 [Xanthoria calcicola]